MDKILLLFEDLEKSGEETITNINSATFYEIKMN